MKKGESVTVTYQAWDTSNNSHKTGDVSNHTCQWSKDGGTPYTLAGTPLEVGGGNYKITLSATDTNCKLGTLIVTSSTQYVVIVSEIFVFSEGGSAPTAAQVSAAVWNESSRTLTASPTDVSGLATASSISTLQTKVEAIPTTAAPTAATVAAAVWNESSRTLTASPTDVSALATSSDLADVKNTVDKILGVSSYFTIEENTLQTYDENGTELQAYTLTVDTKGNITGIEPTAEE